jgi:polyhydroxybutyrate depolymerase
MRVGLRLAGILLGLVAVMVAAVFIFYGVPLLRCSVAQSGALRIGFSYRALTSGGQKRCYLLYVPSSYRAGDPAPVVFSLHGFMSDPYDQRHYSRWEGYAEEGGFLVVYPQGSSVPLRWNVGPGARIDGVDDVRFIEDTISELSSLATVDQRRIFVTGFSNGGEKANQIGCALANKIAAIGVVSGLGPDYPGGCSAIRPLPVVAFIGTDDELARAQPWDLPIWFQDVIFNVSVEALLPGPATPENWAHAWALRNGCQPNPTTGRVAAHVVSSRYSGCTDNADVVLYTVQGGGHAWPGGPSVPIPGLGESTTEIDASRVMWDFFLAHPLIRK